MYIGLGPLSWCVKLGFLNPGDRVVGARAARSASSVRQLSPVNSVSMRLDSPEKKKAALHIDK
jgi:hypothetical protein